jgi:hypothetical protein
MCRWSEVAETTVRIPKTVLLVSSARTDHWMSSMLGIVRAVIPMLAKIAPWLN